MASLILSQAVEARLEARALRAESDALRSVVRANLDAARARSHRAAATADAGRVLRMTLLAPSPWSGLAWRRDDDALETTLVPLRDL